MRSTHTSGRKYTDLTPPNKEARWRRQRNGRPAWVFPQRDIYDDGYLK